MTESQRKKFPNVFGDSPITKNGRNMVLLKIGRKHPTGHNDTSYVVIGAKMNFLRNSIRANSEKRKTLLLPPLIKGQVIFGFAYMIMARANIPKYASNTLPADDLAVWCSEEFTTTATLRIQETIYKVHQWTEKWVLTLNTSKTSATLFTLSTRKEAVKLKLGGQAIAMTDAPTFLGVTLDPRLI